MAGSTTYPEQVDNKVELTDGVDIIQADDVNDAYVPIDAIETFVGASGAVQAKNTDILAFLESVVTDMVAVWKDADTLTINAGRVFCKKSDNSIRVLRKNTSNVDVTFADIDTGARATSTTYYVWAVADASATTVTFKISLSSTAPTGVTLCALVAKFKTNATGSGEIIEGSVMNINRAGMLLVDGGSVSGAASFTITGLEAGAKYRLILNLSGDMGGQAFKLRFNNDSGANYTWVRGASVPAAVGYYGSVGDTSIDLSYANIASGEDQWCDILIQPLESSNNSARVLHTHGQNYSSSISCGYGAGMYAGAAEISSLTIFQTGTASFSGKWKLYKLL